MTAKNNLCLIILVFFFNQLFAERMTISLKMFGITLLNGTISNHDNELIITAKSTKFASLAHRTENYYRIEYEADFLTGIYYKNIKQSNYREERRTEFFRDKKVARRQDILTPDKSCEYEIKAGSRDFFCSLFKLRELSGQKKGELWLDANKLIWKATFENTGNEMLTTNEGKIETRKIRMDFSKVSPSEKERSDILTNNLVNENRSLYLWFTNDDRSLPVKIKYPLFPFPLIWEITEYEE